MTVAQTKAARRKIINDRRYKRRVPTVVLEKLKIGKGKKK